MVDQHTRLPSRVAIAINSVYYPGVLECLINHLAHGGEAYVVMHCADHSGHTWGDEGNVVVTPTTTSFYTTTNGNGYTHPTFPYAYYSEFEHRGVWFRAINRISVGCCHTMGLYRLATSG